MCLNVFKRSLFIADYFISKFPAMFEYWKKNIAKIFLLRKGVMCYKYIDSMDKYDKTSLPSKEKF